MPASQFQHQRGQVDLAVPVRQHDDFRAQGVQLRLFLGVGDGCHDPRASALQDARIEADVEPAVDDDAARLARRLDGAHVQLRIVRLDRADARQDGAGARAPGMAVGTRLWPRDPLALPIVQGRHAVQAGRRFHAHPRLAALHARKETDIHFICLVGQHARADGDAGRFQLGQPLPRHQRIRVRHGGHDAPQPRAHERIGTGRRAAMVVARLQRDVRRGAAHVVAARRRIRQGLHLGMILPRRLRHAGANHLAIPDDHAADAGIGRGRVQAARRPFQRQAHAIDIVEYFHGLL